MTVVFLYRESQYNVLKFALRGVERYVKFKDIYVVGDIPDWWGYKSIYVDRSLCEFEDVYNQYKAINIDDDLLLMADDIYLNAPYVPIHYYNGKLKDRPRQGKRKEVFDNTLSMYPEINNFNLHRPIPVRKEIFKRSMAIFDKPFSHDAFCFGYPVKKANDCKFQKPFTYDECKGLDMFSSYAESEWIDEVFLKLYD